MFVKIPGPWIHLVDDKRFLTVWIFTDKNINLVAVFALGSIVIPVMVLHFDFPGFSALIGTLPYRPLGILDRYVHPLDNNGAFFVIACLGFFLGRFWFFVYWGGRGLVCALVDLVSGSGDCRLFRRQPRLTEHFGVFFFKIKVELFSNLFPVCSGFSFALSFIFGLGYSPTLLFLRILFSELFAPFPGDGDLGFNRYP